jgi:ABC-2 type transport system permease protein
MLGLILLAALGLNLVSLVVQNQINSQTNFQTGYREESYNSEITSQKESKSEGYLQQVEMLEFLRDNKIPQSDWRYEAAADMAAIKTQIASASSSGLDAATVTALTKTAQDYKDIILANKWEDYYKLKISQIDAGTVISSDKTGIQNSTENKDIQKWQYQYSLDNKIKPDYSDWKSNLVTEIGSLKFQVASMQESQKSGGKTDTEKLNETNNQIQTNMYRLEHNIPIDIASAGLTHPQGKLGFWDIFSTSSKMITIISLLIIVIAGSCVANEFSSGTIKFLLINPIKRGKILFSKYAMVVSFSFLMLLLFYILNILFGMAFYGVGNIGVPYVYAANGAVHSIPGFAYIAWKYLLASVDILVMATLAFAISSLIRSSALAIGIGVFAMLGGKTLILFLKDALKLDWARYLIFANTDLSSIVDGTTSFAHQSVLFALIVVAIHLFVFLLTAWDGFVRREV